MTLWQQLFTSRMLICVFTGFASGLPLYLLLTLVPAWLRTEHVDLKVIGVFTLIQFPYTWKFLWAPLVDRYVVPVLGRPEGYGAVQGTTAAVQLLVLRQSAPP